MRRSLALAVALLVVALPGCIFGEGDCGSPNMAAITTLPGVFASLANGTTRAPTTDALPGGPSPWPDARLTDVEWRDPASGDSVTVWPHDGVPALEARVAASRTNESVATMLRAFLADATTATDAQADAIVRSALASRQGVSMVPGPAGGQGTITMWGYQARIEPPDVLAAGALFDRIQPNATTTFSYPGSAQLASGAWSFAFQLPTREATMKAGNATADATADARDLLRIAVRPATSADDARAAARALYAARGWPPDGAAALTFTPGPVC